MIQMASSVIEENMAKDRGGAIFFRQSFEHALVINETIFRQNSASFGGALGLESNRYLSLLNNGLYPLPLPSPSPMITLTL